MTRYCSDDCTGCACRKAPMEMIPARHQIRADFSDWSTGNDRGCYYSSKGSAINAFDAALQGYDLHLDLDDLIDFHDDDGRKNVGVHNEYGHIVGLAVFSWHRMESGRYEWIGYLA